MRDITIPAKTFPVTFNNKIPVYLLQFPFLPLFLSRVAIFASRFFGKQPSFQQLQRMLYVVGQEYHRTSEQIG